MADSKDLLLGLGMRRAAGGRKPSGREAESWRPVTDQAGPGLPAGTGPGAGSEARVHQVCPLAMEQEEATAELVTLTLALGFQQTSLETTGVHGRYHGGRLQPSGPGPTYRTAGRDPQRAASRSLLLRMPRSHAGKFKTTLPSR